MHVIKIDAESRTVITFLAAVYLKQENREFRCCNVKEELLFIISSFSFVNSDYDECEHH